MNRKRIETQSHPSSSGQPRPTNPASRCHKPWESIYQLGGLLHRAIDTCKDGVKRGLKAGANKGQAPMEKTK